MRRRYESGEDIARLRSFVGLTQAEFARAVSIGVAERREDRGERLVGQVEVDGLAEAEAELATVMSAMARNLTRRPAPSRGGRERVARRIG
jgi:hypothetical protein